MGRLGLSLAVLVFAAAVGAGCVTVESYQEENAVPAPNAAQTTGSAVLLPECDTRPKARCSELLILGFDILLSGGDAPFETRATIGLNADDHFTYHVEFISITEGTTTVAENVRARLQHMGWQPIGEGVETTLAEPPYAYVVRYRGEDDRAAYEITVRVDPGTGPEPHVVGDIVAFPK